MSDEKVRARTVYEIIQVHKKFRIEAFGLFELRDDILTMINSHTQLMKDAKAF